VLFLLIFLFLHCFYANCGVDVSGAAAEHPGDTFRLGPRVQAVSDIGSELRSSKIANESGRKETDESHETTDASHYLLPVHCLSLSDFLRIINVDLVGDELVFAGEGIPGGVVNADGIQMLERIFHSSPTQDGG